MGTFIRPYIPLSGVLGLDEEREGGRRKRD